MRVATFTLRVETDEPEEGHDPWYRERERVLADLPAMLSEMEENLNDLLPEGYYCKIEEAKE